MKLDLTLKSPASQQTILALQDKINEWQTDNPDFEDELYQVITFHIIQTLIEFNLVEFNLWVVDVNLYQTHYDLTHILEPLPWTLQAIRDNQDFDWFFYQYLKQSSVDFIYQSDDSYLLKVYSDNIDSKNLQETLSKQALVEILTKLKLTFETYIKQHFSKVLPKNYLAMFDDFYTLVW